MSSHPGELPPEVLTEPYVTLSRHTAPIIQLPLHWLDASARTDHDDQTSSVPWSGVTQEEQPRLRRG
jgi:hypothetical protein